MKRDENDLLTSLVGTLGKELRRLKKEPDDILGLPPDLAPPVHATKLGRQLAIMKALTGLTSMRTAAAQGWARIAGEAGQRHLLLVLAKVRVGQVLKELSAAGKPIDATVLEQMTDEELKVLEAKAKEAS